MRIWAFVGIKIVIIATVMVIVLSVSLLCSHTKTATAIGTEHHSSEYIFKTVVRCFVTCMYELLNVQPVPTVNNCLVCVFDYNTLTLGQHNSLLGFVVCNLCLVVYHITNINTIFQNDLHRFITPTAFTVF